MTGSVLKGTSVLWKKGKGHIVLSLWWENVIKLWSGFFFVQNVPCSALSQLIVTPSRKWALLKGAGRVIKGATVHFCLCPPTFVLSDWLWRIHRLKTEFLDLCCNTLHHWIVMAMMFCYTLCSPVLIAVDFVLYFIILYWLWTNVSDTWS